MTRLRLTDGEFTAVTALLHAAAGLAFDDSRRESLAFCVAERLRATGCADVASYLGLLAGPDGGGERQALLDEVTIPETHFFRNPPQIRALRKYVLPELLRHAGGNRRLRIWSAGCSTGEEPYTIAMLIRELLPASAGWDVRIVATDLSTRALAAAQRGRYGPRAFVMTDQTDRQRFFAVDPADGAHVVRDEVRELVEFRHHNLVTDPPPAEPGELDLVLCRNVTIYFDRDTTRALMGRLHRSLRDGGYLFLGHAETLWQISEEFTLVPLGDAFVYRRLDDADGRRGVLPDRRTEAEPRATANRRTGPPDRRSPVSPPVTPAAPAPRPRVSARPPKTDAVAVAVAQPDPMTAARAAIYEGRYADAADLCADIVAATPLRAEAHYLHGVALANRGSDVEALAALRRALYLDADNGFAHFLLAGCLDRLGERVAAARSYRAAATTLGRRPLDAVAPELGGRSVAELASLCAQLARRADDVSPRGGAR